MPNISDITGYTWVGNDNLSITSNQIWYFNAQMVADPEPEIYGIELIYYDDDEYSEFTYIGFYSDAWLPDIGWAENVFKSIVILGGTDVTNPTLISWLEANGTLTAPQSQLSVDLTTLTGWSDVSAGSHTLKVKAKATGYRDSALSTGVSFTKAGGGN